MSQVRTWLALSLAVMMLLALPVAASSAHPELLVIAHPDAPVTHLNGPQLESIFTLSNRRWDNGETIIPFNLAIHSPGRVVFDLAVLRMEPDYVSRFWLDRRIRGQGSAPRIVPSAALMGRLIGKLKGAIGYVPAGTPLGDARIVARIRAGKVMAP